MHMIRKTAWSNLSLVGCQVSCFVDNLKWHQGTVLHYHRGSKKHYVGFNGLGECRWLDMMKMAFYICERAKMGAPPSAAAMPSFP
jgi:hypothetical protein